MKKTIAIIVAVLFLSLDVFASSRLVVTGHVQELNGTAVPGALILVEGTQKYVLTDTMGDFSIETEDDAVLEVSFFGMETVKVQVQPTPMVITLKPEAVQLDQVVVTGYNTISKESYTGSASTVSSASIEDRAVASVGELLSGNVTGALSSSSGQPGEAVTMILRGFGSMNATNQPLFVVDGVVWDQENVSGTDNAVSNPLNTLNPSDIANFTVLKDAASASLYGSRGANGVVVITTKKGALGEKPRVSFATNNGFSIMTGNPSLLGGRDFADLWVEGQMNMLVRNAVSASGVAGADLGSAFLNELKSMYADKEGYRFAGNNFYDFQAQARQDFNNRYAYPTANGGYNVYDYFGKDADKLPDTDWFRRISRVAPFSKTTLTVRGGGDYVNYYSSLEYFNQQGTIINSQLERYSMRMRLTSDSKERTFNWGINTYLSYTIQSGPMAGGSLYNSPQYASVILPPVIPARLEDGSYNFNFPDNLLNSNHNPLASANLNLNRRPALNVNVIADMGFRLTPWLKWDNKFSIYYLGFRRKTYYNSEFGSGYSSHGSLTERDVHRRKLSASSLLSASKKWTNGHVISATAGLEGEDLQYTYQSISVQGFGNNDSPFISNSANVSGYSGDGYGYGLFSLLSTADYSYKSKYLLGASFRRDYSSMFAPGHRAGNFWSLSAGYDMAKERYMRKLRRNINKLKAKASFGVNGTLPTQYYAWQDLFSTVRYTNELGAYSAYRYCPDLSWEQNRVFNTGVDASFFRNRLDITVEYFNRKSRNLLQDVNVSMVSGYRTMLMNTDAGILNRGMELSINGTVISSDKLTWDLGVKASKMSSIYYGLDNQYLDNYSRQIVSNGVNVHTWYLKEYGGIDELTGSPLYKAVDEEGNAYLTTSSSLSDYSFDKQGVPKIFGSLSSDVKWGGFSFEMMFTYGLGHWIYDRMGASIIANDGATHYAIGTSQLDRWTPDHVKATNPIRINESALYTRSTRYLVKGDYLKLKNVKLTYNLPRALIRKVSMSRASVFLQAENPFVISALGDYDPEMSVSGYRFADLYPTSTTVTLGINTRF